MQIVLVEVQVDEKMKQAASSYLCGASFYLCG